MEKLKHVISTRQFDDSEFLLGALFAFLELTLENVLVGDGNSYLGFDLEQLILHIQDHLLDHLFRIFGLIDKVVEIGANQS